MLKVLHVIFSFSADGAETMLVDMINFQAQFAKIDLLVINNIYNQQLIRRLDKKVGVHLIKRNPGSRNPFKFLTCNYWVFRLDPDIIHFHSHNAIGIFKYKGNAKTMLTIHGLNRPIAYLNRYDRIISISKAVAIDIKDRAKIDAVTIYNGIDFNGLGVSDKRPIGNRFKIVQIGRLFHEIKGQDILLRAVAELLHNRKVTCITLDIIGEGPSLAFLEGCVQRMNLSHCVRFLGFRDRGYIFDNLQYYSLLVQPSVQEGFGLTIVEAMGAKIPTLISDLDGPLEVIDYGKLGWTFRSLDHLSCADQIQKIVGTRNSGAFDKKVSDAFEYARDKFDIKKTSMRYIKEYRKLL